MNNGQELIDVINEMNRLIEAHHKNEISNEEFSARLFKLKTRSYEIQAEIEKVKSLEDLEKELLMLDTRREQIIKEIQERQQLDNRNSLPGNIL